MAFGDIGTRGKVYSRVEIVAEGIHRNPRGGIQGSSPSGRGAESVLATGGYEDDVDLGHTILYTGQGGQHPDTRLAVRPQVADQELKGLNATLAQNVVSGEPVRVIRAATGGYTYDGLFRVVSARDLLGKSGYRIWQFELHELPAGPAVTVPKAPSGKKKGPAPRVPTGPSDRIIRDTKMAQDVKKMHDYQCQVCGVRLLTKSGGYAEGAHIVALGLDGPDDSSNLLCLCPNHHALFDMGGLYVTASWEAVLADGTDLGPIRIHPGHAIDPAHVADHRGRFGF